MVNKEHSARLKESVQGWNEWRLKNQGTPDLNGADLRGANLSDADLSRADLRGADLRGADLRGADLNGAYLSGVDLRGAYLIGPDLYGSSLSGANLSGLDLSGFDLSVSGLSGANLSRANLSDADLSRADLYASSLSGANLSRANLSDADLSGADLTGANLAGAKLSGANLSGLDFSRVNLSGLDLSRANLSGANFSDADLSRANLTGANLTGANLKGSNLSGANLIGLDLSGFDLSGANLSGANLSKTQALGTDFTNAKFTGACLEDWNINSDTKLNNIDCLYVYLKSDKQERRPSSGEFAPGEFTKRFQKALETVDLIFRNGVDWEAFAYSFRKTQVENESSDLAIQNIEIKGDGMVVVGVKVSSSADKAKFHSDFVQGYEFAHKVLSERYKAEISSKDAQIVHYGEQVQRQGEYINNLFYLLNQQQTVQKAMAENPGKISNNNFYNPQFGGGFVDAQTVNAQQIDGNITNYAPDMRQNLAEAGAEIQQLLNQLAQTNPTTDAVTEAIHQEIKRNPTLKARLISALKAGVLEGLKTFVNHPLFNIPAETIKGFLEAE